MILKDGNLEAKLHHQPLEDNGEAWQFLQLFFIITVHFKAYAGSISTELL